MSIRRRTSHTFHLLKTLFVESIDLGVLFLENLQAADQRICNLDFVVILVVAMF